MFATISMTQSIFSDTCFFSKIFSFCLLTPMEKKAELLQLSILARRRQTCRTFSIPLNFDTLPASGHWKSSQVLFIILLDFFFPFFCFPIVAIHHQLQSAILMVLNLKSFVRLCVTVCN